MKKFILAAAIFVFVHSTFFAQSYGKVFTNEEANILYGKVIQSLPIDIKLFRSVVDKTNNFLMFNIIDGEIVLAGDNRVVLYPENKTISETAILNVASKKVVQELIDRIGAAENSQVFIEKRSEVTSITLGDYTLEQSSWCPPFCPEGIISRK